MKIPEPIIDPTTSAVASSREIALTNWACGCWVVVIQWSSPSGLCRARGNLVAPAGGRYVVGRRSPLLSREDRRAPAAPGRGILRSVRRGRRPQQRGGAASAGAV